MVANAMVNSKPLARTRYSLESVRFTYTKNSTGLTAVIVDQSVESVAYLRYLGFYREANLAYAQQTKETSIFEEMVQRVIAFIGDKVGSFFGQKNSTIKFDSPRP